MINKSRIISSIEQSFLDQSSIAQIDKSIVKYERDDILENFLNKSQLDVPGPIYNLDYQWLKQVKGKPSKTEIRIQDDRFRIPGPNVYETNLNQDQNLEYQFSKADRFKPLKKEYLLKSEAKKLKQQQDKIIETKGGYISKTSHNLVYQQYEGPGPIYKLYDTLSNRSISFTKNGQNQKLNKIDHSFYDVAGKRLFDGQKKPFLGKLPLRLEKYGEDSPGPCYYQNDLSFFREKNYSQYQQARKGIEVLRSKRNELPMINAKKIDKNWRFYLDQSNSSNQNPISMTKAPRFQSAHHESLPGVGQYNLLNDNNKIQQTKLAQMNIQKNQKFKEQFIRHQELNKQVKEDITFELSLKDIKEQKKHQRNWSFSVGDRNLNYFGQENISIHKRSVSPGPIYFLQPQLLGKNGQIGNEVKKSIFDIKNNVPGPSYNPPSGFDKKVNSKKKFKKVLVILQQQKQKSKDDKQQNKSRQPFQMSQRIAQLIQLQHDEIAKIEHKYFGHNNVNNN